MIYVLRTGWCALESIDMEIKHLDNWLIDWSGTDLVHRVPYYSSYPKARDKGIIMTPIYLSCCLYRYIGGLPMARFFSNIIWISNFESRFALVILFGNILIHNSKTIRWGLYFHTRLWSKHATPLLKINRIWIENLFLFVCFQFYLYSTGCRLGFVDSEGIASLNTVTFLLHILLLFFKKSCLYYH